MRADQLVRASACEWLAKHTRHVWSGGARRLHGGAKVFEGGDADVPEAGMSHVIGAAARRCLDGVYSLSHMTLHFFTISSS